VLRKHQPPREGKPVSQREEPLKVLLVDDYIPSRNVLEEFLETEDISIVTAENGLEAIHVLKGDRFDLVITDLKMPGATGIEVLRKAQEVNPDVQVIIITGYASLETAIEAVKAGAYDYITRPFRLDEMKVVVENACRKIRLLQENRRLIQNLDELYQKMKNVEKQDPGGASGKEITLKKEVEALGSFLNFRSVSGATLPLTMQKRRSDKGYVLVELEKLGQLRNDGVLSQDEFDRCKRKILEKL
jgi:YesN/AraC family two-component response regulator